MSDDKKTLKFQMMMSPAEAKELDDWMFEHRVRSRAEAIRRLCQTAMNAEPFIKDTLTSLDTTQENLHAFGDRLVELIKSDADIEAVVDEVLNSISTLFWDVKFIRDNLNNVTLTEGYASSGVLQHLPLEKRFQLVKDTFSWEKEMRKRSKE